MTNGPTRGPTHAPAVLSLVSSAAQCLVLRLGRFGQLRARAVLSCFTEWHSLSVRYIQAAALFASFTNVSLRDLTNSGEQCKPTDPESQSSSDDHQ